MQPKRGQKTITEQNYLPLNFCIGLLLQVILSGGFGEIKPSISTADFDVEYNTVGYAYV